MAAGIAGDRLLNARKLFEIGLQAPKTAAGKCRNARHAYPFLHSLRLILAVPCINSVSSAKAIFKYAGLEKILSYGELILTQRTGFLYQGFDELLAPVFLNRVLSLHGAGSIGVFLRIDQFPGPFLLGVLGPCLVVMFHPGIDVLRCADIIASIFEASQDVNEDRHTQL